MLFMMQLGSEQMNYLLLRQIVQTNRKKEVRKLKLDSPLDLPNPELIHSELQKSLEKRAGEHKKRY